MAEEKKKSFPKIPRNNWFLLREKFKQRAPEKVSASYIATALSMGEASARANIIPPLRAFGLIDEAGRPSELAYDWRDDGKYPKVCRSILESTYPQEVRDLFHDAGVPFKEISSWFARAARVGESAARGYAATYLMLLEADLTKAKEAASKTVSTSKATATKVTKTAASVPRQTAAATSVPKHSGNPPAPLNDSRLGAFSPKVHIDIQIHISPDSSPEQIDKIFESMAKNLRGFQD